MSKYLYSVAYRRDALSRRIHHVSVVASSADEARVMAKMRDPNYLATVRSPQRRAAVTVMEVEQ